MCLLIQNSLGLQIPLAILEKAANFNSHGYGRLDLRSGKVKRTMDMKEAVRIAARPGPAIHHFRYATVGSKCVENTHPARVGSGWYLFQNGTVSDFTRKSCTDTQSMAELLKMVAPSDRGAFLSAFSSRYILANARTEEVLRTGEGWVEKDGVWYSNSNSFPYEPKKYTYQKWSKNEETGVWEQEPEEIQEVIQLEEVEEEERFNYVAVYGTLKSGHALSHYLDRCNFVGVGDTVERHRLCVSGVPALIRGGEEKDGAQHVEVEVYEVSDLKLAELDRVESHPHLYKRAATRIQLWDDKKQVWAWVYFFPERGDNGKYLRCFGESWKDYQADDTKKAVIPPVEALQCPYCNSSSVATDEGYIYCDECGKFDRVELYGEWISTQESIQQELARSYGYLGHS